jgi:hypothetical protein
MPTYATMTAPQKAVLGLMALSLLAQQILILNVETVVLAATGSFGLFVYSRFGDAIGEALDARGASLRAAMATHSEAQAARLRTQIAVAEAHTPWAEAQAALEGATAPLVETLADASRPALVEAGEALTFVGQALGRPTATLETLGAATSGVWATAARHAAGAGEGSMVFPTPAAAVEAEARVGGEESRAL